MSKDIEVLIREFGDYGWHEEIWIEENIDSITPNELEYGSFIATLDQVLVKEIIETQKLYAEHQCLIRRLLDEEERRIKEEKEEREKEKVRKEKEIRDLEKKKIREENSRIKSNLNHVIKFILNNNPGFFVWQSCDNLKLVDLTNKDIVFRFNTHINNKELTYCRGPYSEFTRDKNGNLKDKVNLEFSYGLEPDIEKQSREHIDLWLMKSIKKER